MKINSGLTVCTLYEIKLHSFLKQSVRAFSKIFIMGGGKLGVLL